MGKKVVIVSCGCYADTAYACPGDWRCFTAAVKGEGYFTEPMDVIGFVKCRCPGGSLISNIKCVKHYTEFDCIALSTCFLNSNCPYLKVSEVTEKLKEVFGCEIIVGTHQYK